MYEISVAVVTTLLIVSGVDYARKAWIGETSPVLATWILMLVMMSLSFAMYWGSPRSSWGGNIAVTAGVLNLTIILTGVVVAGIRHKTLRVEFSPLQCGCLVAGSVMVMVWFLTKEPLVSYTLVQCIALVAYIGTVQRLRRAKGSTEPYFLWVAVLLSSVLAIYPAWVKNDLFSWIYLGRTIPSTAGVIILIAQAKRRKVS